MSSGATVAWLCIAPVKGMRVQELPELHLDAYGARGDRRYVITDRDWHLVNGKRIPTLVRVVPEVQHGLLTLHFPDGASVSGEPLTGEPATMVAYGQPRPVRAVRGPWSAALSAWAGMPLRLVQPVDEGDGVDRGTGAGVSVLSLASVERLSVAAGAGGVDRRRFRMTVGIDGVAAFEEERWLDHDVRVGAAVIRPVGNVGRCAVTTTNPDSGTVDLPTLHLLRRLREGAPSTEPLPLGVWGEVVEPGLVRVGDQVTPA